MSKNSTVADHCRIYALSSPSDKDYLTVCDHNHDDICDRCHILLSVVREIEEGLEQATCSKDEKEELAFIISNTKHNIDAWQAHLIRSVNQDECRLEILKTLDKTSVLLVLDWAMKYLPKKFRESQRDWFGKRGIPWHITVAFRRDDNGDMEIMTFVHVFETSNQENCDVLAILNDVFCQLKSINPELQTVHLRQDNASCYHCGLTIFTAYQAAKRHNIQLKSMDFSDPQGGKGACDRKAATIKSHMNVHLNSGHDIEKPAQMKEAIDSFGGIPGVEVKICGPTDSKGCRNIKWPGISLINNIQFSEEGLKVWKAYNIGPGKSMPWKNLDVPSQEMVPSFETTESNDSKTKPSFVSVKPRKSAKPQLPLKKKDHPKNDDQETRREKLDQYLFTCPEEGCIKSYQRYSALQKHLDCGKHQHALENETLYDRAILGNASRLERGETAVPKILDNEFCQVSKGPSLSMGWALKSSGGRKWFSSKQKDYLNAIFDIGEQSGKKANPSNVSQAMRAAKDNDGQRLFSSDEFLTTKQIASFFSRLAAKRNVDSDEESDDERSNEIEHQSTLEELKDAVMSDLSIQHSHPIVYDAYNLCEMVQNSRLLAFSIAMLNNICLSFGLDTSSIKVKRKKPYTEMLTNLVMGCECQINKK